MAITNFRGSDMKRNKKETPAEVETKEEPEVVEPAAEKPAAPKRTTRKKAAPADK